MTMLRDQALFGAYVGGYDGGSDTTPITTLETLIGAKLQVLSVFTAWGQPIVPTSLLGAAKGRPLLVCLETSTAAQKYSAVTAGNHDTYLKAQAAACKAAGTPIYIRVWSEFNLPDPPWGLTSGGAAAGTAAEFIAAWKHVVSLFRSAGASNVKFIWNPDVGTYSGTADVASAWPGADYVDVLGIDGYGWATKYGDPWVDFAPIISGLYTKLCGLHPTADVWWAEGACGEDGTHDKGLWVDNMFKTTQFPRLKAICWFNINKELNWTVNSSASSLTAFKTNLAARVPISPTPVTPPVPTPTTPPTPTPTPTTPVPTTPVPTTPIPTPPVPVPPSPIQEGKMILVSVDKAGVPRGTSWPGIFLLYSTGVLHHVAAPSGGVDNVKAYQAAGIRGPVTITWTEYSALKSGI